VEVARPFLLRPGNEANLHHILSTCVTKAIITSGYITKVRSYTSYCSHPMKHITDDVMCKL